MITRGSPHIAAERDFFITLLQKLVVSHGT
jgi:hypothetical protein